MMQPGLHSMSTKDTTKLRVGIIQLTSHPAVVLGDLDLLREPFMPARREESVGLLRSDNLDIRSLLSGIKSDYIEWHRERLRQIFDWMQAQPVHPDVLALPECGVPFEALDLVVTAARAMGTTILAGTHTPRPADRLDEYHHFGVRKTVIGRFRQAAPPPAVLPIIGPRGTYLHGKSVPAVFERADFSTGSAGPLTPRTFRLRSHKLEVATFVCAEALQLPSYRAYPGLVAIVAYQRRPEAFDNHIGILKGNQVPVVLANDGAFGGSGVFAIPDSREPSWWFHAPMYGRLPSGDAYIELELNLLEKAPQAGVFNPKQPVRLTRIAPILAGDSEFGALEHEAREAARSGSIAQLTSIVSEFKERANPIVIARWQYILSCLEIDNLSSAVLDGCGASVVLEGLPSLENLETQLAERALTSITEIEDSSAAGLPDHVLARVARVRSVLKTKVKGSRKRTTVAIEDGGAPLGRNDLIREVGGYVYGGTKRAMIVTGLPGTGKSAVIRTALVQSTTTVASLSCRAGVSADFLFEFLHKQAGWTAPGKAPRADFEAKQFEGPLRSFRICGLKVPSIWSCMTSGGLAQSRAFSTHSSMLRKGPQPSSSSRLTGHRRSDYPPATC